VQIEQGQSEGWLIVRRASPPRAFSYFSAFLAYFSASFWKNLAVSALFLLRCSFLILFLRPSVVIGLPLIWVNHSATAV